MWTCNIVLNCITLAGNYVYYVVNKSSEGFPYELSIFRITVVKTRNRLSAEYDKTSIIRLLRDDVFIRLLQQVVIIFPR